MQKLSLILLSFSFLALAGAQPVVEGYEKTIDLRSLVPNSTGTQINAIYTRNRQPFIISTVSSFGDADAFSHAVAPDGTLGAPFQLNQPDQHAAYSQSILDARGNLYVQGVYGFTWKFAGPQGPLMGSTYMPAFPRMLAVNSVGNSFTTSMNASGGSPYPTNQWLQRYSSNVTLNFQHFQSTNQMFPCIATDRANNFWAVGLTYAGDPNGFTWTETGVALRKYDSHMNLLFAKTIPGAHYGVANIATADSVGNLYVLSRSVDDFTYGGTMLRKFTPNGDVAWERTVPAFTALFSESNLLVSDDGRISFLGSANGGVDLFQYSTSGGLIRRTNAETAVGSSHFPRLLRADAFGQLYALIDVDAPGNQRRAVITKFDASGAFLFSFDFPALFTNVNSVMNVEPEVGDIYVGRTDETVGYLSAFSQQPVAKADTLTIPSSTQVSLPVFANDRYMGSYPYQFKITKAPLHGKIITGGTMYYKSDPGYTGPDEFYYRAVRNGLESFQVKVSLTVQ